MLKSEQRSHMIREYLARFTAYVHLSNGESKNDINHDAEAFYCGLLNIVLSENAYWGYQDKTVNLVDMNAIRQNYPAIDLGDPGNRLAVQVSSTEDREKVRSTLIKFFDHGLDAEFDRLIMLIIGSRDSYIRKFDMKPGFDFQIERDIWDTKRLGKEIGRLPDQRQQMVLEYLQDQFEDRGISTVSLYLPPSSALGDGFVGREDKLEEIEQKLRSKVKPIVLSGLGGMGKTELAVRFGQDYDEGHVYFIRFSESFTSTVTAMFRGVSPQPQDPPSEDEQYQTVMALLRSCGERDLLIIDNVDADSGTLRDLMKDKTYRKLKDMKLRLILTTRFDEDRAVGIRPMPNETLYEIFEKHGVSLEESKMDELIEAVNGHTLTIDLMARTLNGKGWRKVTPEMLLEDLRNNTLPDAKYRKIATDYNQSEDQAQIYQHLKVVFDAAQVSPEGKNILRYATLLPADGMNGEYFHEALTEKEQDEFETLIEHGWLNAEDGLLTIHPVIRLVCREELKPDEETCGVFLNTLCKQIDFANHERAKMAQIAHTLSQAADTLDDADAHWLNGSTRLWLELESAQRVIDLYEKHAASLEAAASNPAALSSAYSIMGSAYDSLGKLQKSLEYNLKAVEIRSAMPSEDGRGLAAPYNNLGVTYGRLGDHQKALEYKLKALQIDEKVLPAGHPYLGTYYDNIGNTYTRLGDHQKALEYHLKAMEIFELALSPDHPNLATTYNNIGSTYSEIGNLTKALEFTVKANALFEKILPEDHPSLATSWNNVGTIYGQLGDYRKEQEFQLKALSLLEKILPPEHTALATIYNNLGGTYSTLGNHRLALEYLRKALAIFEKSLPAGHPNIENAREGVKKFQMMVNMQNSGFNFSNPLASKFPFPPPK